jgi:hypothetical protein
MFLKTEDVIGPVCINMDTGLRFRPNADAKTGLAAGVQVIFPDGNTNIIVRASYEALAGVLNAVDGSFA